MGNNNPDSGGRSRGKEIIWAGSSQEDLRRLPREARRDIGYNLRLIQLGEMPKDWRTMNTVGREVYEIRVHDPDEYRAFYIARFPEGIYVLHVFSKKT